MTLLILSIANRILGNRVTSREEAIGLDLSQHGESAYTFTTPGVPATARGVEHVPGHAVSAPADRARTQGR